MAKSSPSPTPAADGGDASSCAGRDGNDDDDDIRIIAAFRRWL